MGRMVSLDDYALERDYRPGRTALVQRITDLFTTVGRSYQKQGKVSEVEVFGDGHLVEALFVPVADPTTFVYLYGDAGRSTEFMAMVGA